MLILGPVDMTIKYREGVAPQTPQHLMSTEEVAAYLRVPVTAIYAWRTKHVGPKAARVGRHLRWRRADVDAWLEEQSAR